MSKIQSESNSQQRRINVKSFYGCGFLCQRYNLKAIHNSSSRCLSGIVAVVSYVKDTIWKQFTTKATAITDIDELWFPMSKIQSESNSQLTPLMGITPTGCGFLCQRYNLKAIHNKNGKMHFFKNAVVSYVKDTIWKQFTTFSFRATGWNMLWFPMSKIQSESNSQLTLRKAGISRSCGFLCQRYNLKAIHNCSTSTSPGHIAVVSYVKDTIWKQFTTEERVTLLEAKAVVSYVKDTIWKQFTTNILQYS